MRHRLNLARRPFVDTRPVNLVVGLLAALMLVLGFAAYRTVNRYLSESARTRATITSLETEIRKLEEQRASTEATIARFDFGELAESAADVNEIARLSNFSWSRFLTRLEKTLPWEVRVVTVTLVRPEKPTGEFKTPLDRFFKVQLTLIAREADVLPKVIRAFYSSPYFDRPEPLSEDSPEQGTPDGWKLQVTVQYDDEAKDVGPGAVKESGKTAGVRTSARDQRRPEGKAKAVPPTAPASPSAGAPVTVPPPPSSASPKPAGRKS